MKNVEGTYCWNAKRSLNGNANGSGSASYGTFETVKEKENVKGKGIMKDY
jgi:hypothetical protein